MSVSINDRLQQLRSEWQAFLEARCPVLRWLATPADRGMVDTFLHVEGAEAGELADIFLRLEAPFESERGYEEALAETILETHRQTRDELGGPAPALSGSGRRGPEGEGRTPSWISPLQDSLVGFLQAYGERFDHMVLVLEPEAVAAQAAFAQWLSSTATALSLADAEDAGGRGGRPEVLRKVRILIVESGLGRLSDEWLEARDHLVLTQYLELDGASLPFELASASAMPGDSGGAYRLALAEIAQGLAQGDLGSARAALANALSAADRPGWGALAAVAQASFAGGLLNQGEFGEAASIYKRAASAAGDSDDPGARRLVISAQFGQANALLFSGRPMDASHIYRQTVPFAESLEPPSGDDEVDARSVLAFEGWRMAAHAALEGSAETQAKDTGLSALLVFESANAKTKEALLIEPLRHTLAELTDRFPVMKEPVEGALRQARLSPAFEAVRSERRGGDSGGSEREVA